MTDLSPEQLAELERRLWSTADQLWANSPLRPAEFAMPVLGLIFLRHADVRFTHAEAEMGASFSGRRKIGPRDYQARGVLYLPKESRFSYLRNELTEGTDYGKALNDAMRGIEDHNEDLRGVLPTGYNRLENATLVELLRLISSIPDDIEGDVFGRIYEYFLGNFAMSEGRRGGEFYTPTSIVKLIVDIIEPFHGRILDPACGSGGMFVQSARFVASHQRNPAHDIAIYGQEKVEDTIRLCKMNLAVHGLSGDIRQANTYYEDLHDSLGRFDFVMANPPFNVDGVDKERIRDDRRFSFGIPSADNANYLWIQIFATALSDQGRAGFVMANSASDAGHSELAIRKKLVERDLVDMVVAISPNFFYTVQLPVTLWFLDKRKHESNRAGTVLFIDATRMFRQVTRSLRDFTPEQNEFLANIARLYRGEDPEFLQGSDVLLKEHFPELCYRDVPGLCGVATLDQIEAHGWSINPGRHVGVAESATGEAAFSAELQEHAEQFRLLSAEAADLEAIVYSNIEGLTEES